MTTPARFILARLLALVVAALFAFAHGGAGAADPSDDMALPPPQTDGGKALMQALKERRSTRSFSPRPLSPQLLSNLLWSAFGINRPASGGRTAPSAHDWQEIDVYVATAEGVFVYEPKRLALRRVSDQDVRANADSQGLGRAAPLLLLFVSDARRMRGDDEPTRRFYAAIDTGFIAQNVYLFCASEGLATVAYISFHRDGLSRALHLAPSQNIVLAQSVGHMKG